MTNKTSKETRTGFTATFDKPKRKVIYRKWDWYYVGDKRKKLYFTEGGK